MIFIANVKIRNSAAKNYMFLPMLLNLGILKDLNVSGAPRKNMGPLSRSHLERGLG
jgi:hypothetical protein